MEETFNFSKGTVGIVRVDLKDAATLRLNGHGNDKSEVRNSKFETNSNSRNKRVETDVLKIGSFEFWICFGFRYSNFEF